MVRGGQSPTCRRGGVMAGRKSTVSLWIGVCAAGLLAATFSLRAQQAPPAPAAQGAAGAGARGGANNANTQLWAALDTKKDGSMTKARMKRAFDHWDDRPHTAKAGTVPPGGPATGFQSVLR